MSRVEWTKFGVVLGTWLTWKETASLAMCFLFWVCVIAYGVGTILRSRNIVGWLILFGITSNALVTLVNGGVMPAVGMPSTFQPSAPIWAAAMGRHWLFLADRSALYYFSPGDICLLVGSLILVTQIVLQKGESMWKKLWKSEVAQDVAEYAVMLAVILIIVIGTIRMIGGNANNVFNNVASAIQ